MFDIKNEDFLKSSLENEIDLIITSPPYNIDINYNGYKDDISYEDYLKFSKEWLEKALISLKSDGRICINIPLDKSKNGLKPVYSDITQIALNIGFSYKTSIVWIENNISRRTAWGSWLRASAPHVISPVEMIIVLYKDVWKKTSGSGISTIERNEFIEWTNGLWKFNGENRTKKIGHPTPFPEELPKRCIKLFSFENDIILDPFVGSGTTGVSAIKNNRNFIGYEINGGYCEISEKRILDVQESDT